MHIVDKYVSVYLKNVLTQHTLSIHRCDVKLATHKQNDPLKMQFTRIQSMCKVASKIRQTWIEISSTHLYMSSQFDYILRYDCLYNTIHT